MIAARNPSPLFRAAAAIQLDVQAAGYPQDRPAFAAVDMDIAATLLDGAELREMKIQRDLMAPFRRYTIDDAKSACGRIERQAAAARDGIGQSRISVVLSCDRSAAVAWLPIDAAGVGARTPQK